MTDYFARTAHGLLSSLSIPDYARTLGEHEARKPSELPIYQFFFKNGSGMIGLSAVEFDTLAHISDPWRKFPSVDALRYTANTDRLRDAKDDSIAMQLTDTILPSLINQGLVEIIEKKSCDKFQLTQKAAQGTYIAKIESEQE